MKTKHKKRFLSLLLILLTVILMTVLAMAASPGNVELGTASTFTVLAATEITNTGATVQGQLLESTGAVTLDNNVIKSGVCVTIASSSSSSSASSSGSTYTSISESPETSGSKYLVEIILAVGTVFAFSSILLARKWLTPK